MEKYDIIVIGAGSAGLNVAVFMNRIGLRVLMIEKHLIGGDCLNFGCVPSKALISLSKEVHAAKKAIKLGLKVTGTVNLKTIAKTIKSRQDIIRVHESPEYFRKQGITVELGSPTFISKKSILINGKECSAPRIVLATGSRPRVPKIPGLDKVKYFTNETIFANTKLPKRLVVLGGGPIGVELAQAYSRLGSKVTIIQRAYQLVPKEEKELADVLKAALEEEGIEVKLGYNPNEFEGKNKLIVYKYNGETRQNIGNPETVEFDAVLVASGRKLNIGALDLDKAGIRVENSRLVLDKYLRTTNKCVYACGDVAGDFQFTHWAETQAAMTIKNLLSPFKKKVDRDKIAWVTYTDPELATFGKTKAELDKGDIRVDELSFNLDDVDRAICEGIKRGKLKLYVRKGKIVGGTMLGKNAGEVVGELVLAMTLGIPVKKLFNRVFPYPTMARVTRKTLSAWLGKSLTPRVSGLLRGLYKLFNR
jgi:pyruvate/2-oxoglutarate dehydrogenase complex dihydrolipoamide dehydrogenase (E3) component